ncbi:MAG: serine hydrolase, partial [Fimbriimonadaceae bacterium]|nr:serine hydrolase [Fimbriimonadaceae bacterium]
LDRLADRLVFEPLKMSETGYRPTDLDRCAPTEVLADWRRELSDERKEARPNSPANPDRWIQGSVHDPAAWMMGGVSGNAGLFSTIGDLAIWTQSLIQDGSGWLKPETLPRWRARAAEDSSRALGFDTKDGDTSSAGPLFGANSYGHTGYTGTSIWIDPDAKTAGILLTNRVHPDDKATLAQARRDFHERVYQTCGPEA